MQCFIKRLERKNLNGGFAPANLTVEAFINELTALPGVSLSGTPASRVNERQDFSGEWH
jgi:hypothetical protein